MKLRSGLFQQAKERYANCSYCNLTSQALSHQLACPFFETSAKDAVNVDRVFTELSKCLKLK